MLEKLNKISGAKDEGKLKQAALKIATPEIIKDPKEIWEKAAAFNPDEGWLCLTDKVVIIRDSSDLNQYQNCVILSGELMRGNKSLHIRQAHDAWSVTELTRTNTAENQLMFEESYLATSVSNINKLKYEIYWREDTSGKPGVMRPHAARFAGFQKNTVGNKEAVK